MVKLMITAALTGNITLPVPGDHSVIRIKDERRICHVEIQWLENREIKKRSEG